LIVGNKVKVGDSRCDQSLWVKEMPSTRLKT
jgi:hypothetical protein